MSHRRPHFSLLDVMLKVACENNTSFAVDVLVRVAVLVS